jgi:catechol-2,3-dioxygenase
MVDDVEAVAGFYAAALGVEEMTRHKDDDGLRSIWLGLEGGAILMVERRPDHIARLADNHPALVAFSIPAKDRAAFAQRLTNLGHPVEESSPFTLYARDPEGRRVGFSHYPAPGPGDSHPTS